MKYVALLRGINAGGNNKVEMSRLKQTFEGVGVQHVRTYINSGNVLFTSDKDSTELCAEIETAIEKDFGIKIPVLIRSEEEIDNIISEVPNNWVNNAVMKCFVHFLWDEIDNADIRSKLEYKPDIEDLLFLPGAVVWRIDWVNTNRGSMMKLIGTKLYGLMTVRNINTVRKIQSLFETIE